MGFEKLLDQKKLIVVCGLGGVGKTTLSAALALKAAQGGRKSLVITVDPAKRLAAILGIKNTTPEPKQVWKGAGELHASLLDAKETFDKLVADHAPPHLKEAILANPLYQQLSMMLAGTQEYMAMEKLFSLANENRFDLIVVDTPPARHAIDFLEAPIKMSNMLGDSVLKLLIAPSLKIGGLGGRMMAALGHISGSGILEDLAQLLNLSIGLLDGFTRRSQAIQTLLKGKESAFVLATAANTATVSDPLHFRQQLASLGYSLEGLLINRMPTAAVEIKKEDLAWAKKQKDPIWHLAARLAEEQRALHNRVQKKLKPLIKRAPYSSVISEMAEGISNFEDLKKLTRFL
ncbi:MAG: ArsA-related P-loop ATPase [Deltaproteobacteria bacterium]|nr:ArsA-related P-loop ATPase [Deltaproteobacteria bacterium]MDZ4224490.1 ArsA-related P-loop ATPase [bacterium]